MKKNPYEPAKATESNKTKHPIRSWVTHLFGILALTWGSFSFYLMDNIPMGHPAYGGPDPVRVIAVIVVLVLGCVLLSSVVSYRSMRSRKVLLLLYSVPAIAFVGNLAIVIFREML